MNLPRPRKLIVFAGPSLAGSPCVRLLGKSLRPPIRAGALAPATASLPPGSTVLIVDGEFGQSQAITIAEIREAIEAGFRVYGASSMGALRAVECAPIGMTGLGQIAAAYADGRLVSDDEVALTYDDETYQSITVPLVNVRRMAALLRSWGASDKETADFVAAAHAVHFRERTFAALGRIADRVLPGRLPAVVYGLLAPELRRMWDLKAQDAEAAVATVLMRPDADLLQDLGAGCVPAEVTALLSPDELLAPGFARL